MPQLSDQHLFKKIKIATFKISTIIRFQATGDRRQISLKVYDVSGALVRTLLEGVAAPGPNSVMWDGRDDTGIAVSTSTYFFRLQAGNFSQMRRMLLLK